MEEDKNLIIDEANREAEDYSCPSCGAPIKFSPEKRVLHCDYCGLEINVDGKRSQEENDFFEGSQEDSDWSEETKVVHCDNCGANNVVNSSEISITCPFCGSNQVVETNELSGVKPNRVIPFRISEEQVKKNYSLWMKKKFFVPSKVKKQIPHLVLHGVYLPIWTFDSNTFSIYNGRLGKHYTRTVGSGKNRRTVTEVRYFNVHGSKQVTFDDLIVNAGSKIDQSEINALAPFDTNHSFEYDKRYLAGFSSQHYVVRLKAGWDNAKIRMNAGIRNAILSGYNYDVVSYLNVNTTFNNIKYKYVLIPIWIGTYKYSNKSYRFISNGETGKITGKLPVSAVKVSILVLIILAVVAVLMYFILVN